MSKTNTKTRINYNKIYKMEVKAQRDALKDIESDFLYDMIISPVIYSLYF